MISKVDGRTSRIPKIKRHEDIKEVLRMDFLQHLLVVSLLMLVLSLVLFRVL